LTITVLLHLLRLFPFLWSIGETKALLT